MPNYKSPRNKPDSEFLTGKVSYSLSHKCWGSCLVTECSMKSTVEPFHMWTSWDHRCMSGI